MVADVADPLGVKSVPEAELLLVLRRAAQVPTVSELPPLASVVGVENVRLTDAPACPSTVNAAAPASVTATVLFRPGNTLPNARSLVFVTARGCCTSALTEAFAEFCACNCCGVKVPIAAISTMASTAALSCVVAIGISFRKVGTDRLRTAVQPVSVQVSERGERSENDLVQKFRHELNRL